MGTPHYLGIGKAELVQLIGLCTEADQSHRGKG
jgi:hypothetical protein